MTSLIEHEYPQPQDGEIPRFSGLPTFFRLPFAPQAADLDIGVVGVPWDGGTTNRARDSPRATRATQCFKPGASSPPDHPPFSL